MDNSWTENSSSITFYHRDPLECTQWILGQAVFGKHMTFMPTQNYHGGTRQYEDMNIAEWWWETQVTHYLYFILEDKLISYY